MSTTPPSTLGNTLDNLPDRLELARTLGRMRGLAEVAAGWAEADPQPLNGEWCDDPTVATLARSLGVIPPTPPDTYGFTGNGLHLYDLAFDHYAEACYEVGSAYEDGYAEAWAIQ